MKRLLSLLAAVGFTATAAVPVVACKSNDNKSDNKQDLQKLQLKAIELPIPQSKVYTAEQLKDIVNDIERNVSEQINAKNSEYALNDYTDDFITNIDDFIDESGNIKIGESNEIELVVTAKKESSILKGSVKVTLKFNDNTPLSSVIKETSLGIFNDEPTENEIIQKIESLNPNAHLNNEATITDITLTGATVQAIVSANNLYSESSVAVTFSVLKDSLKDLVQVTDLGTFDDLPNSNEIVVRINEVNPDINLKAIYLTISDITPTGALVTANANGKYRDSIAVDYKINTKDLKSLLTELNVDGSEANDATSIITKILDLNPESGLQPTDLQVTDLVKATEGVAGSATIKPADGVVKYTGSVKVTISALAQIDIKDKLTELNVDGSEANDATSIITKILDLNPESGLQPTDLQVTDLVKATEGVAGSATIKPADGVVKYTGSVKVTISALAQIDIKDKLTELTVDGSEANDATSILTKILDLNPESGLKTTDLQVTDLVKATEGVAGSATIIPADGVVKYTGSVKVTISALAQIDIKDKLTELNVDGSEANDATSIITKILDLNPESGLQPTDLQVTDLVKATEGVVGSATIIPADGVVKYTGSVKVTISALAQIDIKDKLTELNVDGSEANDATSIITKILDLNPESGLQPTDLQVTDLVKATEGVAGSATIKPADGVVKYTGSVKVTISALAQIDIKDKLTELTVDGNEANDATSILTKILDLNPESGLKTTDLQVTDLVKATEGVAGSATIIPADGVVKYTGSVKVTISALAQIDIKDKLTELNVDGNEANDATSIITKILDLNPESGLQPTDLQVTDLVKASEGVVGSATIIPADGVVKYTGSVKVTISALAQIDIKDKLTELTVDGNEANDATSILTKILDLNPESGLKTTDLQVTDLVKASEGVVGSATIIPADGVVKYTGSVKVTISALAQIDIKDKLTELTVDGNEANDATSILTKILDLNPESGLKTTDLQVTDLVKASEGVVGSATIIPVDGVVKYTGSVKVTISALAQIDIKDKLTELTVDGNEANDATSILTKILDLNPESGLKTTDLQVTDLVKASEGVVGSATIIPADGVVKYTGSVKVTISALDKTISLEEMSKKMSDYYEENREEVNDLNPSDVEDTNKDNLKNLAIEQVEEAMTNLFKGYVFNIANIDWTDFVKTDSDDKSTDYQLSFVYSNEKGQTETITAFIEFHVKNDI